MLLLQRILSPADSDFWLRGASRRFKRAPDRL